MQEDSLTLDILLATPHRLRKFAAFRLKLLLLPAVFVLLPPGFVIAKAQSGDRRVEIRFSVFGLDPKRVIVDGERFLDPGRFDHRIAAIDVAGDDMRLDAERLIVAGNRLLEPAHFGERDATGDKRAGAVGTDRLRLIEAFQRIFKT